MQFFQNRLYLVTTDDALACIDASEAAKAGTVPLAEALPAPKPVAVYKPLVISGNLAYVSGHGPLRTDKTLITFNAIRASAFANGRSARTAQATPRRAVATLCTIAADLASVGAIAAIATDAESAAVDTTDAEVAAVKLAVAAAVPLPEDSGTEPAKAVPVVVVEGGADKGTRAAAEADAEGEEEGEDEDGGEPASAPEVAEEDDFDEDTLSLSALESKLRDGVLETFDQIAEAYLGLRELQEERLNLIQARRSVPRRLVQREGLVIHPTVSLAS